MSIRQSFIFVVTLLVGVTAWAIDQLTPQSVGQVPCVSDKSPGPCGQSRTSPPVSPSPHLWRGGIKGGEVKMLSQEHRAPDLQAFPQDPADKGRNASDFLTPDGRLDLKAIRASGYQGPLDLKGFDVEIDPRTGEPILSPSLLYRDFVVPMPQRQDNNILTQQQDFIKGLSLKSEKDES